MGFSHDLKIGKAVETNVISTLIKENPLWAYGHTSNGPDKGADYRLSLSVEVKFDAMASSTGNVAIEFACAGKPSGISATTATFWVTVISGGEYDGMYLTEVPTIRHLIQGRKSTKGGDRNAAEMVLVPVTEFIEKARRIGPAPAFLAMRRA